MDSHLARNARFASIYKDDHPWLERRLRDGLRNREDAQDVASETFTQLLQAPAHADTLLVDRAQSDAGQSLPTRGQTMTQVEARFGAPQVKHAAISGPNNRRSNPPITRWDYAGFSVYFEYNHVVDAVAAKSRPEEIGPKPVQ